MLRIDVESLAAVNGDGTWADLLRGQEDRDNNKLAACFLAQKGLPQASAQHLLQPCRNRQRRDIGEQVHRLGRDPQGAIHGVQGEVGVGHDISAKTSSLVRPSSPVSSSGQEWPFARVDLPAIHACLRKAWQSRARRLRRSPERERERLLRFSRLAAVVRLVRSWSPPLLIIVPAQRASRNK